MKVPCFKKNLILFSGLFAAAVDGFSQSVDCRLPGSMGAFVNEAIPLDPMCTEEDGKAYRYQWNMGEGGSELPWADSGKIDFSYSKPGVYAAILKVSVDDEWLPANTFNITLTVLTRSTPGQPASSTTVIYDQSRQEVWNVNQDNQSVTGVDGKTLSRIGEIEVGGKPKTLALDSMGFLWVVIQSPAALVKVDRSGGVVGSVSLPYGSLPYGVVVDGSSGFAFVSLEGTGRILKINLAAMSIAGSVEVFPAPRALALSHDGKRLFATRFHTSVHYDRSPDSSIAEVAEISTEGLSVTHRIPLVYDKSEDSRLGGSGVLTQLRSIAIHPDGTKAWVTATKANIFRGRLRNGTDFDVHGENSLRSVVAVIDLATRKEIGTLRFDIDNMGMPSAVAFTRNGAHAYVAAQGTNAVAFLNGHDLTDEGTIGPFSSGEQMAPDGLALSPDDSLLFVHNFTTRTLGVYDRTRIGPTGGFHPLKTVPLVGKEKLSKEELLGLQVFYNSGDPRITKAGYISCASCHLEGGSDGLVWDFTERGEGLRKTIPMTGRAGTGHGPVHWSANFDEIQDFEHDIRGPFAGTGLMEDGFFLQGTRNQTLGDRKAGSSLELDALAAYVASLREVDPSPFRNPDGTMTQEGVMGREIFNRPDVGCANCHKGPEFTDSDLKINPFLLHNVGTLNSSSGKRLNDTLPGLDTPTLKGIWRYPPYLHHGSASTLMEVITTHNPEDKHGKTSHLSELEKQQLVAFLRQIDNSGGNVSSTEPRQAIMKKLSPSVGFSKRNGMWEMEIQWDGAVGLRNAEFFDVTGRLIAGIPVTRRKTANGPTYQGFLSMKEMNGIKIYRLVFENDTRFTGKILLH